MEYSKKREVKNNWGMLGIYTTGIIPKLNKSKEKNI